MGQTELALYCLLKEGLGIGLAEEMPVDVNWDKIVEIARIQGVLAISMDGLQRLFNHYDYKPIGLDFKKKMEWLATSVTIEKNYEKQLLSAVELSKIWYNHNIRTLLLKGFAYAAYYPKPSLRPASDMDCYLCGKYEEGNNVMEKLGISVNRDDYRHSTFSYQNIFVENHKICTTVRGRKQRKRFELYLRSLLEREDTKTIKGSFLEKPCDRFNALFFLQHCHRHFLREGITLRYVCDWAMMIKSIKCFDDDFWYVCELNDLKPFADAMTRLAFVVCGIKASWLRGKVELQKHDLLLLEDCYGIKRNAIQYGNKTKSHIQIIQNMFKMRWKYKYFSSRPFFVELATSIWANMFEKNPQIS